MHDDLFESIGQSNWLDELPKYQKNTVNDLLQSGMTEEQAAEAWLSTTGSIANAPFGTRTAGPNLFEKLKAEINLLVCGDVKYKDLRSQISQNWSKYHHGMIMMIAAAIGDLLGVAAVAVVPAVGLLIAAVSKVGVNAWCSK